MELTVDTAGVYVSLAFREMLETAERLGDDRVNQRPLGDTTNAVAALIIHCCEVSEFWLGHVALGRPTHRDRDSEFSQTADVATLRALVDRSRAQTMADIASLDAGQGCDAGGRQFLEEGDTSDAAVVLHLLEELYQHLGHMDLTVDALT
jgi:uncharacterized damage-inducible protein DinB